jgi:hypothetical protein
MGKFYAALLFFVVVVTLNFLLNLPAIDVLTQTYLSYDSFEGANVIAAFELLFHPFNSFWVIPSWIIAGFLGGLLCRSWKGAFLVSIFMGIILSLTWLFLLSRYLPTYWAFFISTHSIPDLLGVSIGMGLLLGVLSGGPAVVAAYFSTPKRQPLEATPPKEIQCVCPHCGTVFQSKPKFCYKCNNKIAPDDLQA